MSACLNDGGSQLLVIADANEPWTLWTFTGIRGVSLPSSVEFPLAQGLSISPTCDFVLEGSENLGLSRLQKRDMENVGHYLLYRSPCAFRDPVSEAAAKRRFFNALMAIEIVKPSPTLGPVIQQFEVPGQPQPALGQTELRSPVNPGQWPSMQCLDGPLLREAADLVPKIDSIMTGGDVRRKNAVHLFQLALEHHHPAIACLLAVASMEACLDVWGAKEFEREVCDLLGKDSRVFPDWNSVEFPQPPYTVAELAYHLHRLRSTVVHGADLRVADGKGGQKIDFLQLRSFVDERYKPTYIHLLCEASTCLACQVLQKSL
jgi:hypothetical protein